MWGRTGRCYTLQTHVTILQRNRRGPLQSKGRKPQAEISPDAPLTLPLDMKTGMIEIENDMGRMRHHLWKTQKTWSPWMLFVPTPLFSICYWPFVICILLCWATSEISWFQRQMRSFKPTLNRPFADHLFLYQGWMHGACLQRDWLHTALLLPQSWGGSQIMDSPLGAAPGRSPARCTGLRLVSLHFQKVLV